MEKDLDMKLYNEYLKGEKGAFEMLYNKYKDKIQYFVYNIVKDYQKAEDITQETFLYVLQNSIKEDYSFKYTIYLIAKSKSINYIKSENKRTEIADQYLSKGENQAEKDLLEIVSKIETKNEIIEAIDMLDDKYRNAIYLTKIEELSYKETANILNESEQNIKNIVYRGKKRLRIILIKKGFDSMSKISKVSVIILCTTILLTGIAFAANFETIKKYFESRGIGNGIDNAMENGYIEEVNMESQEQKVSVENNNIIENMYMGVKIDDFIMDDYNLSVKFTFDFDENIDNVVDLSNLHNIELSDLYILDENKVVIYSLFYDKENDGFEKMCQKHNLDLKWGEFNEKFLNNGLNSFIVSSSKELRKVDLQYNMYTDKYPKSKELDFYFSKITFQENEKEEKTVLTGDWHIHLDVPEKFYNRTEEYYKVISSTNDKFDVYTAKVTDTGFEFGMTISGEKKAKYPEEVKKETKRIIEEYNDEKEDGIIVFRYDSLQNQKLNEMKNTSPYKELLEEYEINAHPILSRGTTGAVKSDVEEGCYIMNSEGKKFGCSLSPSRKSNSNFIDGDKYDFYETYTMTKYNATDDLTMVINYRGTREYIKLQKIQ